MVTELTRGNLTMGDMNVAIQWKAYECKRISYYGSHFRARIFEILLIGLLEMVVER